MTPSVSQPNDSFFESVGGGASPEILNARALIADFKRGTSVKAKAESLNNLANLNWDDLAQGERRRMLSEIAGLLGSEDTAGQSAALSFFRDAKESTECRALLSAVTRQSLKVVSAVERQEKVANVPPATEQFLVSFASFLSKNPDFDWGESQPVTGRESFLFLGGLVRAEKVVWGWPYAYRPDKVDIKDRVVDALTTILSFNDSLTIVGKDGSTKLQIAQLNQDPWVIQPYCEVLGKRLLRQKAGVEVQPEIEFLKKAFEPGQAERLSVSCKFYALAALLPVLEKLKDGRECLDRALAGINGKVVEASRYSSQLSLVNFALNAAGVFGGKVKGLTALCESAFNRGVTLQFGRVSHMRHLSDAIWDRCIEAASSSGVSREIRNKAIFKLLMTIKDTYYGCDDEGFDSMSGPMWHDRIFRNIGTDLEGLVGIQIYLDRKAVIYSENREKMFEYMHASFERVYGPKHPAFTWLKVLFGRVSFRYDTVLELQKTLVEPYSLAIEELDRSRQ